MRIEAAKGISSSQCEIMPECGQLKEFRVDIVKVGVAKGFLRANSCRRVVMKQRLHQQI